MTTNRTIVGAVFALLGSPACGDDGGSGDGSSATTGAATDGSGSNGGSNTNGASITADNEDDGSDEESGDAADDGDEDGTSSGDGPDPTTGGGEDESTGDGGDDIDCDYEVGDNGVLMFEAESLPLVDEWTEASDQAGFFGDSYIYWSGPSYNSTPGNGLLEVVLGIPAAGRYRVQWHAKVGMGSDSTEHNDVWLTFADATDYYGKNGNDPESRRYPRPICEDTDFITMIEALPTVSEAECTHGSTTEGWMKVYSAGATQWRWSTFTSDSDAHEIFVEFDAPGAYTMQLSARADWMLLDRIVVAAEDVTDDVAQAEDQAETPCDE